MVFEVFKYSLKVWATSVLTTPALYIIFFAWWRYTGVHPISECINYSVRDYFVFVLFGAAFSFVTYVAFFILILLITFISPVLFWKPLAFVCGAALTLVTFVIIFGVDLTINAHDTLSFLMYSNLFCISCGAWYCQLEDKTSNRKITANNINHHDNNQQLDSVL